MLESAAVISLSDEVLHWHLPAGRTAAVLPDSRVLWEVMWANRPVLAGVAHTHPGSGRPQPSWTDLTTFAACEAGLGRRLRWWIATRDQLRCFTWAGPSPHTYTAPPRCTAPPWLPPLLQHTFSPTENSP